MEDSLPSRATRALASERITTLPEGAKGVAVRILKGVQGGVAFEDAKNGVWKYLSSHETGRTLGVTVADWSKGVGEARRALEE